MSPREKTKTLNFYFRICLCHLFLYYAASIYTTSSAPRLNMLPIGVCNFILLYIGVCDRVFLTATTYIYSICVCMHSFMQVTPWVTAPWPSSSCSESTKTHTYAQTITTPLQVLPVLSLQGLVCNSLTSDRQGCGVNHSLWTSMSRRAPPTMLLGCPVTCAQADVSSKIVLSPDNEA